MRRRSRRLWQRGCGSDRGCGRRRVGRRGEEKKNGWIMEQWEKNYYISFIVSANNGSSLVVVELDFLYRSEGIHRRWDNSYRITSTSATWDQADLILSVLRHELGNETRETLRTSQFPNTHVKADLIKCRKKVALHQRYL
ncbi:Protein kinase family protein [Cucumis melo var. makuwa]|uniref:Protein kinase family protein n=1 Tax=Cucumis melo var. makuwa TaxID=1194695 RepID=A0A5D3D1D3_CUCMM|nr:Protein kinase family protein [Cucumis melo var. makuwa]